MLVVCAMHHPAYSQHTPESSRTVTEMMDEKLSRLEKKDLTTGILYDRVADYAHLTTFNQTENLSNVKHFTQAWSELYRASYRATFTHPKQLTPAITTGRAYDVVNIGIINASFNILNTGKNAGIEIKDDFIVRKPGRKAFLEKHVTIISPLTTKAWGEKITFKFDDAHILQNGPKQIVELTVDFGNGQTYRTGIMYDPNYYKQSTRWPVK